MNNKGQFSIIAALLISIILVSTVILTYTVIRNDSIQVQPQVLTAIDETNFAIKQILGFSAGYYGSVIRVTGDNSFANQSTFNYTASGLEYVANTHPEWGAGFSLTNLTVHTYWFNTTSYSTGYLSVTYNLTKLGINGVQYAPSCGLTVQIAKSTQSNRTSLIVTREQNEPVTDLEQKNFKFFQYVIANSTWTLVSPSTSPVVYTNGTYQIQPPAGIDANSYVLQVEDKRGIIVVASPFSSYMMDLTWPSTNAASSSFGNPTQSGSSYSSIAADAIVGGSFTSPAYAATVYNFTFYGGFSSGTHNVKAVLVLASNQHIVTNGVSSSVSIGTTAAWYTGTFPTPPTISPSTAYVLMVIPDTSSFNLYYTATTGGTAYGQTGDSYSSPTDPTNTTNNSTQYSIYANCNLPAAAPATDTLVIELLQNGTMRWLGQSLQLTTQSMPIPPLPVKSIHVNQTINGVDSEAPFQIEDWASDYLVPLGLTGNSSVFGDGNMIVFLANNNVSRVTIWWNGSDLATQTPYAFVNKYFTGDNPSAGTLTNGMLTLQFGGSFTLTSTVGSSSCAATFMRLNGQASAYGASPAYVIASGVVRDIVQQEAEWSNGAPNSPNLYAHIVLTLPANATYYTYQLRAMFVQSQQSRTITDLCPVELQSSITQTQTENGTAGGYPIVSTATGTFYNQSTVWAHHWSQFISGANGAGIMFTDVGNSELYSFDSLAGTQTGGLRVNAAAGTIELHPVEIASASFTYALNTIWYGAVSTFSNTTPIYQMASGQVSGSWISVEYPPAVAVHVRAFVPITITNNQSSATPFNFQEKITWNPSSYTSYEASNLGNIRFYSDSNLATPLYAWLETCAPSLSNNATSATAWVKLTSSIAQSGGTLTIYMAFLSASTDFDGNYWGTAPNLSPTYGQYDNGAKVFSFYDNFAGTTIGSAWNTAGAAGTYSVNNGLTVNSYLFPGYSFSLKNQYTGPLIIDAYQVGTNGNWIGASFSNLQTTSGSYTVTSGAAQWVYPPQGADGIHDLCIASGSTAFTPNPPSTTLQVVTLAVNSTAATEYQNYANPVTASGTISLTNYPGLVQVAWNPSDTQATYWFRLRAYPPNNVMPSVSFGSILGG